MSQRSITDPKFTLNWALVGLIAIIVIPVACAGWFDNFKLFAFPFGTFLVALIIPVGLVAISFVAPKSYEEEPEDL